MTAEFEVDVLNLRIQALRDELHDMTQARNFHRLRWERLTNALAEADPELYSRLMESLGYA